MTTTGGPPAVEGMYSQLIDEEGEFQEFGRRPDVGRSAHAGSKVRLAARLSGTSPYRIAIGCLAVLCAVLLISILAVATHDRNKAGAQTGEGATPGLQSQTQDANITALTATVSKLQREKEQLQKEKEQLLLKLAATKAPEVVKSTTQAAPTPITCPGNWNQFRGSCYFVSTVSMHWQASQDFCQTHGAHLAIILTAEEQTFLWNLLPRGHWNAYWFGITDEHTEDQWKWVDGSPLVGGFWEVGEPNNHIDEDCGYMVKTRVLERVAIRSWYDAPCTMYRPFICEKEMNTTAHA